jgi:type II secretory pathway component PulC
MRALLRRLALSPLAAVALLMLAALDLCLAVWLGMVAFGSTEAAVVTTARPVRASAQERTAPVPKPTAAYQATLARPVFFKTRLPYVPPSPAPPPLVAAVETPPPPPPPVPEPELMLAGVTITSGVRKAYLVPKAGGEGAWFSEGEEIQGWRINRVMDSSVAFRMGEQTLQLPLYDASQQE